jgi:hypothetical protein
MLDNDNTTAASGDKSTDAFQSAMVKDIRFVKEVLGVTGLNLKSILSSVGGLNTLISKIPGGAGLKSLDAGLKPILGFLGEMGKIAGNAAEEFMEFEQVAFKTFDQFGVGSENVEILKERLYEAGTQLGLISKTQMDPLEAFKKAASIQETYSKSLARNIFISKENIVEIGMAAELTNVSTDTLIKGFTNVGRSVSNVGKQMETVAKAIVGLGVNVSGVSDKVVANIGKLDYYQFKNGIEGLAKMTAESSRLGINMESMFKKMDELMDPDKAIEFSNTLSQLGFAASQLTDPIRVMFLAENDPAEYQKEIAKLTESMFKFNEETGEAEFLKGNRRVLQQIMTLTNQSETEIMNTGKKYKEMAMIAEELKFSPFDEEDKKLISGLAQYKPGEGFTVTMRDKEGKAVEKNILELTTEDRKILRDEMTIKDTKDNLKKQLSTNEITNQILFSIEAASTQLVVLQKMANEGSKAIRGSAQEGAFTDRLKEEIAYNQTLSDLTQAGKWSEISAAVADIKTGAIGLGGTEPKAEDFIFRKNGGIQLFDEGDLVMGVKESYLKGTPTNMSSSNDMEDRFASLRDKVNPEVKIPISGDISLNLNVTSDKEISKEKLEEILFSTTTVQNLKSKINEAVSNFNLTA